VIHVHPELGILLDDAAEHLPAHYTEFFFGFDVVANPQGVVCALAESMHTLAFRLPEQWRTEALQAGAKPMTSIGRDWVEFNPWNRQLGDISDQDRVQIFKRWCELAYQYTNSLSASI